MRPFYIIGHNTNSIAQVKKALEQGANAIETDVDGGFNEMTINDNDASLSGEPAEAFFRQLARIIPDYPQLCLVILDKKTGGASSGAQLLRFARESLAGTDISLIISISDRGKGGAFYDLFDQLGPRESLMIDQKDDCAGMMDWFWARGATRVSYGDDNVPTAIDHAVALKVQNGIPRFVYTYFLDNHNQMRDAIRAGVDGVIVGDPKTYKDAAALAQILQEPEFASAISAPTRRRDPFDPTGPIAPGYTITVQTLDRDSAGTDANVTFILEGSGMTLKTSIAGNRPGRFEQNNLNEISLYGDIGVPTKLTMQHDGTGEKPAWLPDFVRVRRTGDLNVYCAGFGDWITAAQPATRELGLARYRLKVYTGDVDGAGTDSDIVFTVMGTAGSQVSRRINGNRGGRFERGNIDDIYLAGADVGQIADFSVYSDGSEDNAPWFLDRIELYQNEGPKTTFQFSRWVNGGATATVAPT